jgi:murein DD-endopeptidase MepM/ murein hydrolase activator NlpD
MASSKKPVAVASLDNLGPITTSFGETTKFEKSHKGMDIGFTGPTAIPILNSGVVESVHGGQHPQDMSGYGNYVIIRDPNGNKWRYSHLDSFTLKPGDQVNAGETGKIIGGNTGSVYSLHGGGGYHLDLRIADMYGKYLDPALFLRGKTKTA